MTTTTGISFESRMKNIMKSLCRTHQMRWEDYKDFGNLITKRLAKKKFSNMTIMFTPLSEWKTIIDQALDECLMAEYVKH